MLPGHGEDHELESDATNKFPADCLLSRGFIAHLRVQGFGLCSRLWVLKGCSVI